MLNSQINAQFATAVRNDKPFKIGLTAYIKKQTTELGDEYWAYHDEIPFAKIIKRGKEVVRANFIPNLNDLSDQLVERLNAVCFGSGTGIRCINRRGQLEFTQADKDGNVRVIGINCLRYKPIPS